MNKIILTVVGIPVFLVLLVGCMMIGQWIGSDLTWTQYKQRLSLEVEEMVERVEHKLN